MSSLFIRRVSIRNYKSIAACQVELGSLMFLVGPNGSGKSNFLDALRFASDGLKTSLDHALRERGTIKEVRRRSGGHPNHFSLRFDFVLPSGQAGHYAFRIGAKQGGGYEVQNEECSITPVEALGSPYHFGIKAGQVVSSSEKVLPPALSDRLFLVAAAGLPEFRPLYDALSRIEIYNLNPREIANLQKPDPGDILRRDGSNAASILQHLPPPVHARIRDNLGRIVPGIVDVEPKSFGSQETVEFRQRVNRNDPWRFLASSMSDGTLRAFGVLLSVYQGAMQDGQKPPPLLIGLEEPEIALHPAAAVVLLSALREGSKTCQVLVTSHSPELLDNPDIPAEAIIAVDNVSGMTRIGPIDKANKEAIRTQLATPGELLRQSQLEPDGNSLVDVDDERQMKLFEYAGR